MKVLIGNGVSIGLLSSIYFSHLPRFQPPLSLIFQSFLNLPRRRLYRSKTFIMLYGNTEWVTHLVSHMVWCHVERMSVVLDEGCVNIACVYSREAWGIGHWRCLMWKTQYARRKKVCKIFMSQLNLSLIKGQNHNESQLVLKIKTKAKQYII